jgi:hypothetical protein
MSHLPGPLSMNLDFRDFDCLSQAILSYREFPALSAEERQRVERLHLMFSALCAFAHDPLEPANDP